MSRVHRGRIHVLLAALLMAGFALSAFPPAGPQVAQAVEVTNQYRITDLGATLGPDRYTESRAVSINNEGQIAMTFANINPYGRGVSHPVLYDSGSFIKLGKDDDHMGEARSINNSGALVGFRDPSIESGEDYNIFVYQDGHLESFYDVFGPGDRPSAINNLGWITGQMISDTHIHSDGFLFKDNTITVLDAKLGNGTYPQDINDSNQVVGIALLENEVHHAFLWSSGEVTDLKTLGGSASEARGINTSGQIVGRAQTQSGQWHAFVYQDNQMTDLETLGGLESDAYAINEKGQIVGQSQTASGDWHAFIYENGTMTDIQPIQGIASAAFDINDYGQIVGVTRTQSDEWHAFVADPSPTSPVYYYGLGDSIASGHGLDAPNERTRTGADECRLSDESYPNQVADKLTAYFPNVIANTQLACSGATAAYKYQEVRKNPNKWIGSQALAVQRDIQAKHIPDDQQIIVSITIGANDFEFADPWSFVQLWGVKVRGADFDLALKLRDGNARVGLYSAIDTLLNSHPNLTVILTELYNPFNTESIFCGLGSSRTVIFDQCLPRTEQAVSLWNQSLHTIANEYGGRVQVTSGLKTAFANHRSPGGKTSAGNASRDGGGCGLAGPGRDDTWIQYRNDPDSYSFKIPRAIGIAIDNWYLLPANIIVPWWAQNGNRFSWEYDPDAFHFPTDGWRGDCFHPNRAGASAIAGFVIDAINGALHSYIPKPKIQQAGSVSAAAPLATSFDSARSTGSAPYGQMFGWPQADLPGRAMAMSAGRTTPCPARLT